MARRKVRIGIDVGGTFTDAVAIDNETYEIIAQKKIPTTHKEGVAHGIVLIINKILEENQIDPSDVVFIAHGTTQATNALLEGDVASVGVIGMAQGGDIVSAKKETAIPDIELSPGKYLKTSVRFLDTKAMTDEDIRNTIDSLKQDDCEVIVASGAFSVDNPQDELRVQKIAGEMGMMNTGGHEITELYGLKMRTRTAIVNGSLIPKMMQTANMTEEAVKDTKIATELMIMRADGGVMSIEEVRKRPILTMLSGLAAGVAGALMYENITDGIFFETGGTSVDISVIKNGRVMIKYAQVGEHKTYLQSLDVRTLGLAGGSMVQFQDSKMVDVGPRSAHIAGVAYECFDDAAGMETAKLQFISPKEGDPGNYVTVVDQNGKSYSLTLCGAANLLGYIADGDYAKGSKETARIAWQALGDAMGVSAEEAARKAMDLAVEKLKKVVDDLIYEYELDPEMITLVGGGGSASVLVPALAEKYGSDMSWRIAKNAPYISTIGVALAMVRESIERNVQNPTKEDVKKIRRDVIEKIVKAGALEETVDVSIEIDGEKGILRALATGSTEFRSKEMNQNVLTEQELGQMASDILKMEQVTCRFQAGRWSLYEGITVTKKLWGLMKKRQQRVAVLDREGVARFKHENVEYLKFNKDRMDDFEEFLHNNTFFSDANASIPRVFLFYREKMLDLSGMQTAEQMKSIMEEELSILEATEPILAVAFS